MQYRPSTIASSISNQFPEHYRDDGPDFVEFVKTYYEYLDGANDRNFSKLRDIDSTLEGFLKYYKKKYLHNLPFVEESVADIPFLVKNIGDLYRSKGTSEGLELLFKMFYKTEVETYYPASSILSLSDSKWAFSTFIEFIPVQDVSTFPLQRGDVIEGDTSKATAFIDEIVFYNISGVLTPVGYISNVYGKFTNDDGLRVDRNGVVSYPGKLIYGSISDSTVLSLDATANNKVGDKVKLISSQTGVDAIGQVRAVSDIPTGVVDWQLKDGGWGYAVPAGSTESNGIYTIGQNSVDTENTIYKSTQVLIVQGNEISIKPFDTITADNQSITSNGGTISGKRFDGSATVIKYEHPILYVDAEPEATTAPYTNGAFVVRNTSTGAAEEWPTAPTYTNPNVTVTSTGTTPTFSIASMTRFNDSASFELEKFSNVETVTFLSDIINLFLDVSLDSPNYNMGGRVNPNNSTTAIQDALGVTTTQIGSIDSINILSSGSNYRNNARTVIRNENIFKYDIGLLAVTFDVTDFIINEDDVMQQVIQIEDLSQNADGTFTNPGALVSHTTRAQFVRREENTFFFQPLGYYPFDKDGPAITFKGRTLTIESVTVTGENPSGGNANVEGEANYLSGQITDIDVIKSGFRYTNGETVSLVNDDADNADKYQQQVGKATISVDGLGQTEGNWVTTTSHISDNNRFIHDNYYYQQYSYDISSILDPTVYEKTVKDVAHVAGTKLFGTPLIATIDDVRPQIDANVGQTTTFLKVLIRNYTLNLNTIENAMLLATQTVNGLDTFAPNLDALFNELDPSGIPYGNIDTTDSDISFSEDYSSFQIYNTGDRESLPAETIERIESLIAKINAEILNVESSFQYLGSTVHLYNDNDGTGSVSDDLDYMIEVDTTDPSGYAGLPVAVSSGSFVPGTVYQIITTGTATQGQWNTTAGTNGLTYSQGSVFTAANNGAGLTGGIVIPAQLAVILETPVSTIVDFDS